MENLNYISIHPKTKQTSIFNYCVIIEKNDYVDKLFFLY